MIGVSCFLVADGRSTLRLGSPLWSSAASSLDFLGSRDLNRLVAERTGVLHVEPLAKAALVEKVAAGHDDGQGHLLKERQRGRGRGGDLSLERMNFGDFQELQIISLEQG